MFRVITIGRFATRVANARTLFTWSLVNHDDFRSKAPHKTRWFKENFAVLDAPAKIKSEPGQVMHSEINADLDQLLHTDWTYQFNPYWPDLVESHEMAFQVLYEGQVGKSPSAIIGRMTGLLPDLSSSAEEKKAIQEKLGELKEAFYWATKTEEVYTTIFRKKFDMERHIWEPFERERVLAGLIQLYLDYFETVPDKFKLKIKRELEYHLFAIRRLVNDCPNVKRAFPTLMA